MARAFRIHKPYKGQHSLPLIFTLLLLGVLLIGLALGIFSVPANRRPPGLEEEEILKFSILSEEDTRNYGKDEPKERVEVLSSWQPRAFLYHNFLHLQHPFEIMKLKLFKNSPDCLYITLEQTKDECKYLINIANPYMTKSTVVDNETGKSKDSRVRTSTGTFLSRGQDEIIRRIEKRIADFSFIPEENGEAIQILHYEVEQKYDAHHDYFHDPFNTKNGGQRMATMLMYLADVEKGGETVFPMTKPNSSVPWWDELSECGRSGLSVRPRMGDALLFWSMNPDASVDPYSLHGSCPVIQGSKWSATKWMHVDKYTT